MDGPLVTTIVSICLVAFIGFMYFFNPEVITATNAVKKMAPTTGIAIGPRFLVLAFILAFGSFIYYTPQLVRAIPFSLGSWVPLVILFAIVLGGFGLEKMQLITKPYDNFLSTMLLGSVLLFVLFLILTTFLRWTTREGFTTGDDWSSFVKTNMLSELCTQYTTIQTQMVQSEKDPSLTDTQARERVEDVFSKLVPAGVLSCASITKTLAPGADLETQILSLPDTLLIQAHQTAEACKTQLTKSLSDIKSSLVVPSTTVTTPPPVPKEGFLNPVCSPEIAVERRKFLRDQKLSDDSRLCTLPEEMPKDTKEQLVKQKITAMQTQYDSYKKQDTTTISQLLNDCSDLQKQLETYKSKAQRGTLVNDLVF